MFIDIVDVVDDRWPCLKIAQWSGEEIENGTAGIHPWQGVWQRCDSPALFDFGFINICELSPSRTLSETPEWEGADSGKPKVSFFGFSIFSLPHS